MTSHFAFPFPIILFAGVPAGGQMHPSHGVSWADRANPPWGGGLSSPAQRRLHLLFPHRPGHLHPARRSAPRRFISTNCVMSACLHNGSFYQPVAKGRLPPLTCVLLFTFVVWIIYIGCLCWIYQPANQAFLTLCDTVVVVFPSTMFLCSMLSSRAGPAFLPQ